MPDPGEGIIPRDGPEVTTRLPQERLLDPFGMVESTECRLSPDAEPTQVYRVVRVTLQLHRMTFASLHDDTASGRALGTGGVVENPLVGRHLLLGGEQVPDESLMSFGEVPRRRKSPGSDADQPDEISALHGFSPSPTCDR